MILGIGKETAILLYAGLSGAVVFLSYQILYLFRRLIKHHTVVIGMEDLFYWIAVSVYLFRQMYRAIYGNVRWFFAVGVVLGCLLAWGGKKLSKKIWKKCQKKLEKRKKKR